MSFPVYKRISINSHQKRLIYSQLDQIDFGGQPFIFEMSHMISKQDEALSNIDNYLNEHSINNYTYPIIIISNSQNYLGDLLVVNSLEKVPSFFKIKTKQLNTRENQKLKYVELKQKHMENLIIEEFEPTLNEYTRTHKKIFQLNNENEFLKTIRKKILST